MSVGQKCGRCGAELAESIASDYCPSCLLRDALGEAEQETADVESGLFMRVGTGLTFGNYELLEKVGQGGMGMVYKARQINLDRIVALKLLPFGQFSSEEAVQRFKTEAAAAAGLQHPNIVAIHDVGEEAGQHFFSMDFVEGQTLAELVREKPLPAKRAAAYVKTIAEAVHYAHQHGILHRDLKPSNILIDQSDQPRITDFGLAKRLTVDSDMTLTGQVLGSPNFMAPEQAEGRSHEIGPATEVYSLGALLYHLLTRQAPFQGDMLTTLLKQVIETEPVAPRLLNPSIPRDLETICLKCLEKEPARRYQTAQGLSEDLARFLDQQPIQARPVSLAGKGWKWCRRRPAVASTAAALAVTLLLGIGGVLWQWRSARESELFARQSAYAADMKLVQHALNAGDLGLAVSLLDKHRPEGNSETRSAATARQRGENVQSETNSAPRSRPFARRSATDLRGWEWRYFWQLCRGDQRFQFHRYPDPINAVALSADGKLLAVQQGGDRVGLWDFTAHRPIAELPANSQTALAFSPNDTLLAFSSRNTHGEHTVVLWDTVQQRPRATLTNTASVGSVAFSPDGKLLAMFDDNGTATLVEWRSQRVLTNLTAQPIRRGGTGVVLFSPDGYRLAVGGDNGLIRIVDWPSMSVRPIQTDTKDGVRALAFSRDSKILAAGFAYTSGTIRLWDSDSGEARGQLTNHTRYVLALAFSPDGQWLASASADQTIRIWRVADPTEFHCLRGHRDEVWGLAFSPDSRTLVSGCRDGSVYLWDINTHRRTSAHSKVRISSGFDAMAGVEIKSGVLDPKVVHRVGVAFTRDSRSFIATDTNGLLSVWNAQPVEQTEPMPRLGTNIWGVALSGDDRWLAAGDASRKIQIWDWQARRQVKSLETPFEWFGFLRFSPGRNFLLAKLVFNDRTDRLKIWRTRDWEPVRLTAAQEKGIYSVDLSPDERHLATGYIDGHVKVWSFPDAGCEASWRANTEGVVCVVWSPDGHMLASTSTDGKVRLWDAATQREVATLRADIASVWGAAFSPDGRRLATGGSGAAGGDGNGAVKLWDLATQRELLSLPADGQIFIDIRFSPDGNILAATSLDGVAHLWRAPSWEEIEAAEKEGPAESRQASNQAGQQ